MTQKTYVRMFIAMAVSFVLLAFIHLHPAEAQQASSIYERLSQGERILQQKTYVTPTEKTVYLTFDDGPSKHTGDILDILLEEGIQATFFVLGESALKYPDLVQRIVDEGHAIGNHTYDHRYDALYTSFEQFWKQVTRTDQIIQEITGVQTRLFRAPGGTYTNLDAFYYYYLDQAGYQIYDWTIDSGDSRRRDIPASEIVSHVKNGRLTHEVNVLMHDSATHAETVKALPEIIQHFKDEGYVFKPITESVRPVQQSLGNLKWDRSNTQAMHEQRLALVSGGNWTESIPASKPAPHPAPTPAPPPKPKPEPYPLHIQLENATSTLALTDHLLVDGRYYIPLREWNAWQGGKIQWDHTAQIATERYGSRTIEWDVAKGEVSVLDKSHRQQNDFIKTEPTKLIVHNGRIYVSIRELTILHDMKIVSVHLHPKKREIILRN